MFHMHVHAVALLQVRWVLSTCRVHIVQLQAHEQVEVMGGENWTITRKMLWYGGEQPVHSVHHPTCP